MKPNSQLMNQARESLSGRWGIAIGGYLIYNIIIGITQNIPIIGFAGVLIIGGPMLLGSIYFSLNIARGKETNIEVLFDGFKLFGKALGTYLLMMLYIIAWTLLLIIPGIIKGISYSQTFYLLAEDDSLGSEDAILKSMEMMEGNKMKYFLLGLNFIPWALLCILTLGIGFLWLVPYAQVSYANFYLNLKGEDVKVNNDLLNDEIQEENQ
jgi:uncharacterized membrane protein